MALSLPFPTLSPLSHSFKTPCVVTTTPSSSLFSPLPLFTFSPAPLFRAYCTNKDGVTSEKPSIGSLDDEFLRRLSGARDADHVLDIITESGGSNGALKMDTLDCNSLIAAAFDRGNSELALSLFDAMRFGFSPGLNFGMLTSFFGSGSLTCVPCFTSLYEIR